MSHMVYMHLRRPLYCDGGWRTSEEPLFLGQEALHWTEHSERNLINNVAATMGYPKCERDFLGRWVPQQSDDYLRTARNITHKLQRATAQEMRQGGQQVEEAAELSRYKTFLLEKVQVGIERADYLVALLDIRGYEGNRIEDVDVSIVEGEDKRQDILVVDLTKEAQVVDEDDPLPEKGYFLSYTAKHGYTTLHVVSGCWRRPGREIKRFSFHKVIGDLVFSDYCRDCWRRSSAPRSDKTTSMSRTGRREAEDPDGQSSSSSSSSSTDSLSPSQMYCVTPEGAVGEAVALPHAPAEGSDPRQ